MFTLASPIDDYGECHDCGEETMVETVWLWDSWFVTVTCPECGTVTEFETNPREEAAIRY